MRVVIMGATADAIRKELDHMNANEVAPGLAVMAVGLAEAFDRAADAPTSQAVVARELSNLMARLRVLAVPTGAGGKFDELKRRRKERLKASGEG